MNIEIMKQALEALETCGESETYDGDMECYYSEDKVDAAITALRLAIEQAEKQEPVVMWDGKHQFEVGNLSAYKLGDHNWIPLYTAPPQRQPLTREQVLECEREADAAYVATREDELRPSWASIFARAVERKHGIGGGHD